MDDATESAWKSTWDASEGVSDRIGNLPLIYTGDWIGKDVPPREWMVQGWIAKGSAALLSGSGGVGKSLLAQLMCTCIATAHPFLGVPVNYATALYITCEDDADELRRRQEAINAALGLNMLSTNDHLILSSLKGALGNELGTFDEKGIFTPSERMRDIEEAAQATGAKFIALDNIAHMFAGNENVRHDVATFCNAMDRLAMRIAGSVLFLGHPSKGGDEYSGSTGWDAHVRQRLFMGRPDSSGGIEDLDSRILRRSKANYARTGEEIAFRWFDGAFVLPSDIPPNIMAEQALNVQANAENTRFLELLALTSEQRRAVSHIKGTNYAPRIFAMMTEAQGMKEQAFARAMERLLSIGKIRLDQPLWRGPNRVMKQGIKLASECTDPPAQTPCTDPHAPPAQVVDFPCTDPHASTPLYTTYMKGAASAAAPSSGKPESSSSADLDDADFDQFDHAPMSGRTRF